MSEEKQVAKLPMVEEVALAKIKSYQSAGMTLPEGFNPTNSLKKARFMLNEMKDKNGVPVLQSCTQASIVQSLLESVAKGLDVSETQGYLIPRGNQMTFMESVYGRIVRAKRASKYYKPIVNYVHEGDVFEIGVDFEKGGQKITKHETKLENLDKPIIAAYTFVTDNDGNTEVFIMTKKEWMSSWMKSPNKCAVAKEFERDMIFRTIIKKSTKALVNGSVNAMFVGGDNDDTPLAGSTAPEEPDDQTPEPEEFHEAEETPVHAPTHTPEPSDETGQTPQEEVPSPKKDMKKEPKPSSDFGDDLEF